MQNLSSAPTCVAAYCPPDKWLFLRRSARSLSRIQESERTENGAEAWERDGVWRNLNGMTEVRELTLVWTGLVRPVTGFSSLRANNEIDISDDLVGANDMAAIVNNAPRLEIVRLRNVTVSIGAVASLLEGVGKWLKELEIPFGTIEEEPIECVCTQWGCFVYP